VRNVLRENNGELRSVSNESYAKHIDLEDHNRNMKHVGWFIIGPSHNDGSPYAYGDLFISVYAKEEQKRRYRKQDCNFVPVYVPCREF
jgi:hypothetical protein